MLNRKDITRIKRGTMHLDLNIQKYWLTTSTSAIQPSHARISDAIEVRLYCQYAETAAASGLLTENRLIKCLEDSKIATKKC